MARSPSKYTPGHGTPSSLRRSWLDHAAHAEARSIAPQPHGRAGRAADRRKNRKSWKAQAKILKRAGRSRRGRRRIMAAGYQMAAEARQAAAGLAGAHGKGFAASRFKRLGEAANKAAEATARLGPALAKAMSEEDWEPRDPRIEADAALAAAGLGPVRHMVSSGPAVPTLSAAEAFAVHEAEHSGPMEACPHQLCQWATLLGAP